MYTLTYSKEVKKQLRKLNRILKQRIILTLERVRIRPYAHLKRLVGCPYFSLRVGDYRVILNVKDDKLIILVLEVGHRKKVYKR